MHKIVLLALLVKTARTVPFIVYRFKRCFWGIFVFLFKKSAFKTLNVQFFIKNALILCNATVRAYITFPKSYSALHRLRYGRR
jgi:hypothetical protein